MVKIGIRPTAVNFIGLFGGLLSAILIGRGELLVAGIALLISGLADSFDGVVARTLRTESDLGTFLDNVFDRYVDTAVLLALAWYFMSRDMLLYVFLASVSVLGIVITSYSRARALSLGLPARKAIHLIGPERMTLLLIVGLFIPSTLLTISWLVAILSNVLAVRRVLLYASSIQDSVGEVDVEK